MQILIEFIISSIGYKQYKISADADRIRCKNCFSGYKQYKISADADLMNDLKHSSAISNTKFLLMQISNPFKIASFLAISNTKFLLMQIKYSTSHADGGYKQYKISADADTVAICMVSLWL